MKDKEAKRFTSEKGKIEALIEKHRPRTLKAHDEVSTSGKNAKKGNPDTLLGDLVANTTIGIAKAKEKGQKIKLA